MAVGIVGRILQRAQLSRWLAAAINGQPVVVVLDGPPGVGKSTLVDWLVAEATEHGAVHRVVTVPERGDVAEDLRQAIADTDEAVRRGSPQLVIIDDAHWLDDAGQHLVEHLAFRLGTAAVTSQPAGVCLVLVMRDDSSGRLVSPTGRRTDHPPDDVGDARRSRGSRTGDATVAGNHRSTHDSPAWSSSVAAIP